MEIFAILIVGFVIWFLIFLLEEDLHTKFRRIGNFTELTYSDFVKNIRRPNQILHTNGFLVAKWSTSSNWFETDFEITLIFDEHRKFLKCQEQRVGNTLYV